MDNSKTTRFSDSESILYKGTTALGTGNCRGSGWRNVTVETRGRIHNITEIIRKRSSL